MKKIILSVAMVSVTFAFAQKKEVSAAFKAIEAGNTAEAKQNIAKAEALMNGKVYVLEPNIQEQYYYTKGLVLIKEGKTVEGAAQLANITDLGKNKIYAGKEGKTKVYISGKAKADASGISNLKEEAYKPVLTGQIIGQVNPMIQAANTAALEANNKENFDVAGPKFLEVYNLLKAAGQDNKQYLYFSAITYARSSDKAKGIEIFKQLIDSGYTGVETRYFATDKSGQQVEFDKATWDLMKKTQNAEYKDFKNETSPNIEPELYESAVGLMIEAEKYDDAIAYAQKGMEKFPKNTKLTELKGLAYYRAGRTDEFMASLKELVAKNPQDKISWYNLGVLSSKDPSKKAEAETYFKKTVEIDPSYAPAYQNLTYMTMDIDNDQKHIDKYNELRKAGKMNEANKVMEDRRDRFAKALPYAEQWYKAAPEDIDAVGILKGLYQTTKNEVKYQEFKAKEAALQAKQK